VASAGLDGKLEVELLVPSSYWIHAVLPGPPQHSPKLATPGPSGEAHQYSVADGPCRICGKGYLEAVDRLGTRPPLRLPSDGGRARDELWFDQPPLRSRALFTGDQGQG